MSDYIILPVLIFIMRRKILFIPPLVFLTQLFVFGQVEPVTITLNDASRIISFLSDDSLKGRGDGRPELLRAGLFIADEFRNYGLKPFFGNAGYFMPFRPF